MKNSCLAIFIFFCIAFTASAYADTTHYSIIVDAGSSGSKAHLFKYQTGGAIPVIEDIFSANTKPGLSSFANNPNAAGLSLKNSLDSVNKKLIDEHIDPRTVPINILGTAGMRLLPQLDQSEIYDSVETYIKNNYAFPIEDVYTLSGKSEALYDWLDVNYLEQNFQNNTATVGTIDMGGASTQIAFETKTSPNTKDQDSITIGGKNYVLFSKSFLGLGLDQARESVSHNPLMTTCYPLNYPINSTQKGFFNFIGCDVTYSLFIGINGVALQIPSTKNQSFVAFSGVYYAYQFFNVEKTPNQASLEKSIEKTCDQSWDQLKQQFPKVPESYLSTYCANGIYLDQLIYNTYKLEGSKISVLNSINKTGIDWTLGAMLHKLIN